MLQRPARRLLLALLIAASGLACLMAADPGGLPDEEARAATRQLISDGRFDEARARAEGLRQAAAERNDILGEALALDLVAEAMTRSGKGGSDECMSSALGAIEKKKQILGEDDPEVGVSQAVLGQIQIDRGDLPTAIGTLSEALGRLEGVATPRYRLVRARALNLLGIAHFYSSSYAAAGDYWTRSLRDWEKIPGSELESAKVINNLGNLAYMLGRLDEARSRYEQVLTLRRGLLRPGHPSLANSYATLGLVEFDSANYAEAERLYRKAIEIQETTQAPPALARQRNNLAILYATIGDFKRARKVLDQAIAGVESAENPDHGMIYQLETNMALLLADQGSYQDALELVDRVYEPVRALYGDEHVAVDNMLGIRARSFIGLGRYREALEPARHVLALRRKVAPDHNNVADALVDLGRALRGMGQYEEAGKAYGEAIEIYARTLGAESPRMASARRAHAVLLLSEGHDAEALHEALESERIRRNHLRLVCSTLPERQALDYARRRHALDVALTVAMSTDDASLQREAWDGVIRSRAVVLDEMAMRQRLASLLTDDQTGRLVEALRSARGELASLVVDGPGETPIEEYRHRLEAAEKKKEDAEKALAARVAGPGGPERARAGLTDVAASRPDGTALVAFVRYENYRPDGGAVNEVKTRAEYGAFVLGGKSEAIHAVPLGPADQIDRLVGAWRAAVSPADPDAPGSASAYREAASRLRQRLWDPVEAWLAGADRVFLVPDGALSTIHFGALPVGEDRYLVETGPLIHLLSAERDIAERTPTGGTTLGLLALGGADFDAPARGTAEVTTGPSPPAPASVPLRRSGCGEAGSLYFPPLPGSKVESREVAEAWSRRRAGEPSLLLTGAAASEDRLEKEAPGRRILHLATHGFFLGGRCALEDDAARGGTARGIGGVTPDPAPLPGVSNENPLVLSGLALAGANHRGPGSGTTGDGILTAEEIAGLDLRGVEWAVLSACDTGLGQIRAGEGVLGLRRALEVAGVRTVIMSLWSVEDQLTHDWMRSLYEARLEERLGTAESVRRADLDRLRAQREAGASTHPFFWAGFVAAGDWR